MSRTGDLDETNTIGLQDQTIRKIPYTDINSQKWVKRYNELVDYINTHHKYPLCGQIRDWVRKQRRHRLTENKKHLLERLPNWQWSKRHCFDEVNDYIDLNTSNDEVYYTRVGHEKYEWRVKYMMLVEYIGKFGKLPMVYVGGT